MLLFYVAGHVHVLLFYVAGHVHIASHTYYSIASEALALPMQSAASTACTALKRRLEELVQVRRVKRDVLNTDFRHSLCVFVCLCSCR